MLLLVRKNNINIRPKLELVTTYVTLHNFDTNLILICKLKKRPTIEWI